MNNNSQVGIDQDSYVGEGCCCIHKPSFMDIYMALSPTETIAPLWVLNSPKHNSYQ